MTRTTYETAYREGFSLTLNLLLSRGACRDAAEEVAQAAWTRGWERLDQLLNDDLLKTWVNTIAINFYRRAMHLQGRMRPLTEMPGEAKVDLAAIDLDRLMSSCYPQERNLLALQLRGLTTKEMAQEIGVTETAVRIRLMRARRAARAKAEKRGGSNLHVLGRFVSAPGEAPPLAMAQNA